MSKKIENLDKQKLQVLELYLQLESIKFGKTKKEKYREIAKRLKIAENTINTWVRRYYEDYLVYLQEAKELEENSKISNFEGLTEKQSIYIIARLHGNSPEKAKELAGYSPKTKAADIEKNPKIRRVMAQLREELKDDVKLSARSVINKLVEVSEKAEHGIEYTETEYHDETNPDGRKVYKNAKKKVEISISAAVNGWTNIAKLLGYDSKLEAKHELNTVELAQQRLAELKAKKLEKELKDDDNQPKVLK